MNELHLGILAHTPKSPFLVEDALEILSDGALLLQGDGRIAASGSRQELVATFPDAVTVDHGDAWLIPGLVDGHIHFPQFYATASYGKQLLDWLNQSIFPAELKFKDFAYAQATATAFVKQLLSMGTTTALVFGSQFVPAMEALFEAARVHGLRLVSGLTLMDRFAPEALLTNPAAAYEQCSALIASVSANPLLHYAITPRFALSCTPAMLEMCGQLKKDYPECWVQTHINENFGEIEGTLELFPEAKHYLDVYDRAGLIGPGTVLAHSIHSSHHELMLMKTRGASVCHCPCSNLYLGSGLFPLASHLEAGIPVMVGTDVGAGGHFSILRELSEVYKVQQLNQMTLSAAHLLFLGTLAGAQGLGLDQETGSFEVGKSGDFLVLSAGDDAYLTQRLAHCDSHVAQLFVLLNQATGAHVRATYVQGRLVAGVVG